MKVLVTGACGFVGNALARRWKDADPGVRLYGLDNLSRPGSETNRAPLRSLGVDLFHGDLRLPSDLEGLPPVDWVVDAAADPSVLAGGDGPSGRGSARRLVEQNLLGTVNLLEYCRRHRAGLVLLSTSRVYSARGLAALPLEVEDEAFRPAAGKALPPGAGPAGITEGFSTAPPLSLYGSTKLASELLAIEHGESFGFPVFVVRCGTLAGAGQFGRPDQGVFSWWIHAWLSGRPLAYLGYGGRGHQVRDLLHPLDLLELVRRLVASGGGDAARVVNAGGGEGRAISLARLSRWCSARFGPREVAAVPEARPLDVPWLVLDSSLAVEAWGWRPSTPLSDILEEIALHAELNPDWLDLSAGG